MAVVERAKLQDEMISELQSYVCSCATMVMFWRGEGECIKVFEFLVLEFYFYLHSFGDLAYIPRQKHLSGGLTCTLSMFFGGTC